MTKKTLTPGHIAFIERLRMLFKRSGYRSHRDFARVMGFDHKEVSRWFSGTSEPTRTHILRLSSSFFVSVAWLVDGEDPAQTEAELRHQRNQRELIRQFIFWNGRHFSLLGLVFAVDSVMRAIDDNRPINYGDLIRLRVAVAEARRDEFRSQSREIYFDYGFSYHGADITPACDEQS